MRKTIYDEARIIDGEGGLAQLQVDVATLVANPKRRAVLAQLALSQLQTLEQLVKEMEHDEVERLSRELTPIHQSNGDGE